MLANKDKGTSVGFTKGEVYSETKVKENYIANTVCKEHEWETFEKRNNSNMVEAIGDFCILCGIPKPKTDFKIKDNLEVIEDNVSNEFLIYLSDLIEYYDRNRSLYTSAQERISLSKQVKEKYLEIKKKNT